MMATLYVAPAGAMQFLLRPNPAATSTADARLPHSATAQPLWVKQPVQGAMRCGCTICYEVVLESLRPEHLAIVRTALAGRSAIYVCRCAGDLIE